MIKLQKHSKITYISLLYMLFTLTHAYAESCGSYQTYTASALNFGSLRVITPTSSASAVVTYSGSYGSSTNTTNASGQQQGSINIKSNRILISITSSITIPESTTLSCTGSDCSSLATNCNGMTLSNITADKTSQSISSGSSKDFYLGGTLNIPANCGSGTFTGTLSVPVQNQASIVPESCTANVPITVTLQQQPIEITADNNQVLNFGEMLSTQAHIVTVSPNSNCSSTVPTMMINMNSCSAGRFYISKSEAGNQPITINISPSTLSNRSEQGSTLTLSDYQASLNGTTILLNNSTQISQTTSTLLVGAKLTVPQGASGGDYEGTYTVTISY